jgi:hypothetical protein
LENTVTTRAPKISSMCRNVFKSRSMRTTWAPLPTAMRAAFAPTTPAPRMVILAGGTPGTPPSRIPMPPCAFSSECAPACTDMRPATSDMGASSGSPPRGEVMVS